MHTTQRNINTPAGWADWCQEMENCKSHVAVHGGPIIGLAYTQEQAIKACEASGYTVAPLDNGGQIDRYDAEDGPNIHGYEHDGKGLWIVACYE